jgi:hypothetical protein
MLESFISLPIFIQLIIALLALWIIRFAIGLMINRRRKIIVVSRMPPTKVLRAHQLGLTWALALSTLAILFTLIATDAPLGDLFPFLPLLVLVLFVGSVWGWPWLLIIGLGVLWLFRNDLTTPYLRLSVEWYLWGYIFGAVMATLYNDLAYWFTRDLRRKDTRVAWAFHTDHPLNVIKSPDESEMTVQINERDESEGALTVDEANMTVEVDPGQRLYDFNLAAAPPHPYTIAFVANPWILKYQGNPDNDDDWEVDPIIRNRDLFLRMVDSALSCLEQDEVVGQREIWSRVRVLAMFNENLINMTPNQYGMLQPYHNHPIINGQIAENLIDTIGGIKGIYDQMISEATNTFLGQTVLDSNDVAEYQSYIDVIFALSAYPLYTRSTAHFSDWDEATNGDPYQGSNEDSYVYCPDPQLSSSCPDSNDNCSKSGNAINVKKCGQDGFACQHEHCATIPGRIALNVIRANSRTYIHEFAHAMSSAFRGAIVDEYFDRLEAHSEDPTEVPDRGPGPFMINRIERVPNTGRLVPVPKVFAEYQCARFNSDLSHPSARENWVGYFPDRIDPNATCIMDRRGYYSRFDELLSNFIYDRLVAKINRS